MAEPTFADTISRAFETPEDRRGTDTATSFPFTPPRKYVDLGDFPDKKALPRYEYGFNCAVFVLYRPYIGCPKCKKRMGEIQDGDEEYTCPHTHIEQYKDVVNSALAGTYILKSESESVDKEGVVTISVKWLIPTKKK